MSKGTLGSIDRIYKHCTGQQGVKELLWVQPDPSPRHTCNRFTAWRRSWKGVEQPSCGQARKEKRPFILQLLRKGRISPISNWLKVPPWRKGGPASDRPWEGGISPCHVLTQFMHVDSLCFVYGLPLKERDLELTWLKGQGMRGSSCCPERQSCYAMLSCKEVCQDVWGGSGAWGPILGQIVKRQGTNPKLVWVVYLYFTNTVTNMNSSSTRTA